MPILDIQCPKDCNQQEQPENGPLVDEFFHRRLERLFGVRRPGAALAYSPAALRAGTKRRQAAALQNYFFFATAFISDSSTTGAGPEIPPSFRMRQKCTAMKIDATSGIPM